MWWNLRFHKTSRPLKLKQEAIVSALPPRPHPVGLQFELAADQLSFSGKRYDFETKQNAKTLTVTPIVLSERSARAEKAEPLETVESLSVPHLKAGDMEIHVATRADQLPLAGRMKLVEYEDLQRTNLLPQTALNEPSLKKPILFSRFMFMGSERVNCIMYVPCLNGKYIPRPVYQSRSHGSWQTPNFVARRIEDNGAELYIDYFGKGVAERGKTETALSPCLQKYLSEASVKQAVTRPTTPEEDAVWAGVARNRRTTNQDCDHYRYTSSVFLEALYPGCKIHPADGKRHMQASEITIPPVAKPDFGRVEMTYTMQNGMYGEIDAEVYPSCDGKLLWTFYLQKETQRAWVAHAHAKDCPLTETGLPVTLINIGENIPLAPFEYDCDMQHDGPLPSLFGTPYMDVWDRFTSKLPLIHEYYLAKGLNCPA